MEESVEAERDDVEMEGGWAEGKGRDKWLIRKRAEGVGRGMEGVGGALLVLVFRWVCSVRVILLKLLIGKLLQDVK